MVLWGRPFFFAMRAGSSCLLNPPRQRVRGAVSRRWWHGLMSIVTGWCRGGDARRCARRCQWWHDDSRRLEGSRFSCIFARSGSRALTTPAHATTATAQPLPARRKHRPFCDHQLQVRWALCHAGVAVAWGVVSDVLVGVSVAVTVTPCAAAFATSNAAPLVDVASPVRELLCLFALFMILPVHCVCAMAAGAAGRSETVTDDDCTFEEVDGAAFLHRPKRQRCDGATTARLGVRSRAHRTGAVGLLGGGRAWLRWRRVVGSCGRGKACQMVARR